MVRSIRRPQPALLDAQDRQRPELLPEVRPGEGAAGAARDLDGRDARRARARLRQLHRGGRLPGARIATSCSPSTTSPQRTGRTCTSLLVRSRRWALSGTELNWRRSRRARWRRYSSITAWSGGCGKVFGPWGRLGSMMGRLSGRSAWICVFREGRRSAGRRWRRWADWTPRCRGEAQPREATRVSAWSEGR